MHWHIGTRTHDGAQEIKRHMVQAELRKQPLRESPAFFLVGKPRGLREPGAEEVVRIVLRPQLKRLGPEQDFHHFSGQRLDIIAEREEFVKGACLHASLTYTCGAFPEQPVLWPQGFAQSLPR